MGGYRGGYKVPGRCPVEVQGTVGSFSEDQEQSNGSRYRIGPLLVLDADTGGFVHPRDGKDCVFKP